MRFCLTHGIHSDIYNKRYIVHWEAYNTWMKSACFKRWMTGCCRGSILCYSASQNLRWILIEHFLVPPPSRDINKKGISSWELYSRWTQRKKRNGEWRIKNGIGCRSHFLSASRRSLWVSAAERISQENVADFRARFFHETADMANLGHGFNWESQLQPTRTYKLQPRQRF